MPDSCGGSTSPPGGSSTTPNGIEHGEPTPESYLYALFVRVFSAVPRWEASMGQSSAGGEFGRREFLRGIAAAAAMATAGGLLAARGSSGSASAPQAGPSLTRRRGGSLKVGLSGGSGQDTLDPHR